MPARRDPIAATGLLPSCVDEVSKSAESLYDALHADFPALPEQMPSDTTLVFLEAHEWFRNSLVAYGVVSTLNSPHGLASQFHIKSIRVHSPEYPNVMKNAQFLPDKARNELHWRTIRHYGTLNAIDVFGPIPLRFDPSHDSSQGINACLESVEYAKNCEWSEMRKVLQHAHLTVRALSLGFIQWVNARIDELKNAVVPTIEVLESDTAIRVRQAGFVKMRKYRGIWRSILVELNESGIAMNCPRQYMSELKNLVPELAPHIGTGKQIGETDRYAYPGPNLVGRITFAEK